MHNVAVHTYCTEGFFPLLKTFVESYCMFNDLPLIIDMRGFNDAQWAEICSLASKSTGFIIHKPINWNRLSVLTGLDKPTLLKYKNEAETKFGLPEDKIDLNAKVWKLLHAGDARIKAMHYHLQSFDAIIQFDTDTLFRDSINKLAKLSEDYDFCAKLRLGNTPKVAISIGLCVYKNTSVVNAWIKEWTDIIDSTPPMQRPLGFGQISCYNAFKKYQSQLKFLDLITTHPRFGIPWSNGPTDIIWTANTHGIAKSTYAPKFKKEIERLKSEIK